MADTARARSCPACHSIGVPRDGCEGDWHTEVRDPELVKHTIGFLGDDDSPTGGGFGEYYVAAEVDLHIGALRARLFEVEGAQSVALRERDTAFAERDAGLLTAAQFLAERNAARLVVEELEADRDARPLVTRQVEVIPEWARELLAQVTAATFGICRNPCPGIPPMMRLLVCDLPAGHLGWHGCNQLGASRASWSPSDVAMPTDWVEAVRKLHEPTLQLVEWFHDQTGKGYGMCCPSCRPKDPTKWHPREGEAGIEPEGFVPSYVLSPCPTLIALQEGGAGLSSGSDGDPTPTPAPADPVCPDCDVSDHGGCRGECGCSCAGQLRRPAGDPIPAPADLAPGLQVGGWHLGRAWAGHEIEDACPCPQQSCGLVDFAETDSACLEHPHSRARTIRQGHPASDCPGAAGEPPERTDYTAADGPSQPVAWQPGDPVHPREPDRSRCIGCGCEVSWSGPIACPECGGPMDPVTPIEDLETTPFGIMVREDPALPAGVVRAVDRTTGRILGELINAADPLPGPHPNPMKAPCEACGHWTTLRCRQCFRALCAPHGAWNQVTESHDGGRLPCPAAQAGGPR